jgi:hypothetical protein
MFSTTIFKEVKMKKSFNTVFVCLVTVLLLLSTNQYAQEKGEIVGKIITSSEADALFGPAIKSISINAKRLLMLAKRSPEHIMFNVVNGEIRVLNNKRKALHPEGLSIASNERYHMFSTSKLLELMNLSGGTKLIVQLRANDVLTILAEGNAKSDSHVLEFALGCPPWCQQ